MKATIFPKVWTICLIGLLAISSIGCNRDELPTATETTTEVTPQKPLTLTGIYWARGGNVYRANADGTEIENIHGGPNDGWPNSIALDVASIKIYWTTDGRGIERGGGKIRRADLTGANDEDILTGLEDPYALALDLVGGKIYWSEGHNIRRANLDGTSVKHIVRTEHDPVDIALDVVGGKLYWCTNRRISRANLDGINVQDIVITSATDIALDVASNKLYWVEKREGKIRRANLNGTNVEDSITGLEDPRALALDVAGGKIYWAEGRDHSGESRIRRVNLNSTNVEDIITIHRLGIPYSIALAPS